MRTTERRVASSASEPSSVSSVGSSCGERSYGDGSKAAGAAWEMSRSSAQTAARRWAVTPDECTAWAKRISSSSKASWSEAPPIARSSAIR